MGTYDNFNLVSRRKGKAREGIDLIHDTCCCPRWTSHRANTLCSRRLLAYPADFSSVRYRLRAQATMA